MASSSGGPISASAWSQSSSVLAPLGGRAVPRFAGAGAAIGITLGDERSPTVASGDAGLGALDQGFVETLVADLRGSLLDLSLQS